jgi:hypothetical protein
MPKIYVESFDSSLLLDHYLLTIHEHSSKKQLVLSTIASEILASTSGNSLEFIPEYSVTSLPLPTYITTHLIYSLHIVKKKVG